MLRELPLTERKRRLARLIARSRSDRLRLVEHFDDGKKLLAACADAGLEGVVASCARRPTVPARAGPGLKVKCQAWRDANRDRHELFAR